MAQNGVILVFKKPDSENLTKVKMTGYSEGFLDEYKSKMLVDGYVVIKEKFKRIRPAIYTPWWLVMVYLTIGGLVWLISHYFLGGV